MFDHAWTRDQLRDVADAADVILKILPPGHALLANGANPLAHKILVEFIANTEPLTAGDRRDRVCTYAATWLVSEEVDLEELMAARMSA